MASARKQLKLLLGIDPDLESDGKPRELSSVRGQWKVDPDAVDQWRRMWQGDSSLVLSGFRLPPKGDWKRLARSVSRALRSKRHSSECKCGILRKLASKRIDLDFEHATLEEILTYIRDHSTLFIIMDARAAGPIEPEERFSFRVKDLRLENALVLLLAPRGYRHVVASEHIVLVRKE